MAQTLSAQDIAIYRDLHKDVHGVRPPHGCHPRTVAEYRREMDRLGVMLQQQQDAEDAEARARGFANHSVWFWFWANQEEFLMAIEAFGPIARWCPVAHNDGTAETPMDQPETADAPSVCPKARDTERLWAEGAF